MKNGEERGRKHEFCLTWIRVLLSTCITLMLGVFGVVYTIQQGYLGRIDREQDQKYADTLRKQSIYDSYMDEVSKLFLSEWNISSTDIKLHIRIKTLNTLQHVDINQKREIIQFLYERKLLRSDRIDLRIDLSEADLNYVEFISPCNLNNLYLPDILADKIVFDGCQLQSSVFNGATMREAKFLRTALTYSQFIGADLRNTIFKDCPNRKINFANGNLIGTSFKVGPNPQGINFTNVDLFQSDLTDRQLSFDFEHEFNTLLNTRFPNGSFSQIDPTELIIDGGFELSCLSGIPFEYWKLWPGFSEAFISNGSELSLIVKPVNGNCYLVCALNGSELYEVIDVYHFSYFIDSGQAQFNLSAIFSCPFSFSSAYVKLGFYTKEFLVSGPTYQSVESKEKKEFHFEPRQGKIPKTTRYIYVSAGAKNLSTNVINPYCLIDQITLNIFKPN